MGAQLHTVLGAADRRRSPRLHLQVPMFIRASNSRGEEFVELAKTLDISSGGAYLACSRVLRMNELVSLTIPAPPPSHSGLVPTATPPIQARVRRVEPTGDMTLLGVEFTRPLD